MEIIEVPEANYEGQLLITVLPRLGLCRTITDAIVLISNGAVVVDGREEKDLNYRMLARTLIRVGLREVRLGSIG